ncbi:MAG: WG repeat-containing protein [Bacteroides sp.]|nr:WG repeat-containing protein [Bacteroides sp.]MBD5338940.1 WG repeat-containing protein [Bacteroides sp.]
MEQKNIKDLANNEFSNVRVAVDYHDYDIEKDSRLLIPFSYYQYYGMMDKSGKIVVEPKFNRILDSCREDSDVVRVGVYYTYGFNRANRDPSTYLGTKWGLLNSKGEFILEPEYKQIGVSNDNRILTIQHMDGQYEVMSVDGKVIIPKGKYAWIDSFDSGLSRVYVGDCDKKRWGIVDSRGNIILPLKYSDIWNFYMKNRLDTTVEVIDKFGCKRVGRFNLITYEVNI